MKKKVGIIGVADTLMEKIPQAIENMRKVGSKKIVMLTGDNSQIAQSIAKQAKY